MDKVVKEVNTPEFLLKLGFEGNVKVAWLYLKTSSLRIKFKTPMLIAYNPTVWIKTSGGKHVSAEKLHLSNDIENNIKNFFKEVE